VQVVNDAGSSSAGHLNIVTRYTYDPAGHRLTGVDGNTNPTTLTVDALGRIIAVKDAVNNVQQTQYSPAGEVVAKINARNQTNALTLDHVGRVVTESYLRSDLTSAAISFWYDAKGQMTAFGTSDTATANVYYDGIGRVTSVNQGSLQTTYSYFSEGPISRIVDPAGTTGFAIDQVGNLQLAQTSDSRLGTSLATGYQFDSAARLVQRHESNGATNVLYSNFQYSALDQLIDKNLYQGGVGYVAHWANITYDANGNRLSTTTTMPTDTMAGLETFTYDTADRLATIAQPSRTTLTYGYDAAQNRTSVSGGTAPQGATSFVYLANEALSTETPTGQTTIPYAPDPDGNIQADAPGHQLKYDSLNRLDRVLNSGGTLQVSYVYDALGRLVKRTAGSTVTQFVYQGLTNRVVEELDSSNNLLRAYAWDSMGRQLSAQIYTGGAWRVYVLATDPHGNVVAMVDGSATVVGTVRYDAWGQVLATSGSMSGMPFGFQDGFTDPYTGFVLMGFRWYDPREGRFTAEDPRGPLADAINPLDQNLWAYGLDNPERYVDPTGLWPWDSVVKNVSNAWNSATHWVSSTWNSATDWASSRWDEGTRWARHAWDDGVHAAQNAVNTVGHGVQRAYNWGRRTVARAWHAATRTAHYFASRGIKALGMVARSYINMAKGAVNHVMHIAQAAREVASHVARVVVNTVGSAASAVGSAVKTAWNFCTGSARGAATCLAVAGSVALIASGVGAGAGVGLLATTLFTASSVASAVSFAQTRDPMDALGALPMLGVLKDVGIGARLAEGALPEAKAGGQLLLTSGSRLPNAGGVIRSFVTESDQIYYRAFSNSRTGSFLTAVRPGSSSFARNALALPPENEAKFVQEVLVPAGTRLQRSRALPNFGFRGGGEQFELLDRIPNENFGAGVRLP
jgi:RHS repeat-associated protein